MTHIEMIAELTRREPRVTWQYRPDFVKPLHTIITWTVSLAGSNFGQSRLVDDAIILHPEKCNFLIEYFIAKTQQALTDIESKTGRKFAVG